MKLVELHFQFLSQAKGSSIKGGRADYDHDEKEADKKLEQPHTDRGRGLPE